MAKSRMNIHVLGATRSWREWAALGAAMVLGAVLSSLLRTQVGGPSAAHGGPVRDGWAALTAWHAPASGGQKAGGTDVELVPADERSPQVVYSRFIESSRKVDPVEEVISLVKTDAKFRSDLISRYLAGLGPDENIKTRFVLSESQASEVVGKALEAARGTDPKARIRAVELLASMQDGKPDARAFLSSALDHETDPQVLALAAASLHPQAFSAPKDNEAIIARLRALRQNADERVQNAALSALAVWEGGQAIEKDVLQGMQSPNQDTVVFSIQTALQGQLRSDAFKEQLFAVSNRTDLPVDLRRRVADLLGSNVRLTQREYEQLVQLRSQL